jgi:hypothetical protein
VDDRAGEIARALTLDRHGFERLSIKRRITSALTVEPMLELGCVPHVKTGEEIALIEVERICPATGRKRLFECGSVTPDRVPVQRQRIIARAIDDRTAAEGQTEKVDGLVERIPRAVEVTLWPKKSQQRVASMVTSGHSQGQVGE